MLTCQAPARNISCGQFDEKPVQLRAPMLVFQGGQHNS